MNTQQFSQTGIYDWAVLLVLSVQSIRLYVSITSCMNLGWIYTLQLPGCQEAPWPVWPNCWVFVYKLSGCGFESDCCHLNFKQCVCFQQEVPWHSGNYIVQIHSELHTRHDINIRSNFVLFKVAIGKEKCLFYSVPWI